MSTISPLSFIKCFVIFSEKKLFERKKKIINKDAIFENLMSFKRAGANAIVSYYADRLNEILP